MVLTALRGALGFLSRAPVGRDERAWRAFRSTPAALPLAGYAIGAAVALPLALPLPGPTAAALFVAAVYLVTGINHLDGVADLGDAAVVHGDAGRRRAVMADAELGVGGTAAVALVVFALGAAGLAVAALGLRALALVVAAEVGAKLAVAAVACLGSAAHEGLGAELTARMPPRALALPAAVALPAALLAWPRPAAAVAVLAAALTALGMLAYARRALGGVTGDVLGATNEAARLVALHTGVVAWTLS